jgi:hypothetical protein
MWERARAYLLVAKYIGATVGETRHLGLRYLGMSGGDHIIRDRDGCLYGADLVIGHVVLYVGHPPKITR